VRGSFSAPNQGLPLCGFKQEWSGGPVLLSFPFAGDSQENLAAMRYIRNDLGFPMLRRPPQR
jgi:hypothetical protein